MTKQVTLDEMKEDAKKGDKFLRLSKYDERTKEPGEALTIVLDKIIKNESAKYKLKSFNAAIEFHTVDGKILSAPSETFYRAFHKAMSNSGITDANMSGTKFRIVWENKGQYSISVV